MSLLNTLASRISYAVLSPVLWALHVGGVCARILPRRGVEALRWRVGQAGAWVRYQSALRNVPAYRVFVFQHGISNAVAVRTLADIPSMDKDNYVRTFPLHARCVNGRIPQHGLLVDESSGSGGPPTNWVRGPGERAASLRAIKLGLRGFGRESLFFLNAYALGPWAAGVGAALSLAALTRVKTLGPDVRRIENTLREFGTTHHYVILGYPPFLKQVVDRADIDWTQYRVSMLYGGEGMSESMRRYLQGRGIKLVLGAYGASDLDLSVATESKFTIALRRLLEARPDLAAQVLHHSGAMPMILQFNPSDFFIETNAEGELLVTVCRPRYVMPKIRYNIHDIGHVMRMPQLVQLLNAAGVSVSSLDARHLDLPLLFLYGRSDSTVAFYGCKIAAGDVQEALFRKQQLADVVGAFELHTYDDGDQDKRLVVSLEMTQAGLTRPPAYWAGILFSGLAEVNEQFREVQKMYPASKGPTVELYSTGTGPFAEAGSRIKRRYVRRDGA